MAESRSRGATWTVISEAAVYEAERHRQALGDITPITKEDLWTRVAEDMSRKPYKSLGTDLLAAARRDRAWAVDTFIACNHALETAALDNPDFAREAAKRFRAQAINESLSRHLVALDSAIEQNGAELRATMQAREAAEHLRALRAEAAATKRGLDEAAESQPRPVAPSRGPGP